MENCEGAPAYLACMMQHVLTQARVNCTTEALQKVHDAAGAQAVAEDITQTACGVD